MSYMRHECVSHSETISASSPFHEQVTINGKVMMFSGSAGLQFIGNVTGLTLITGVTYSVIVVARNSVGPSRTYNSTFVPCELRTVNIRRMHIATYIVHYCPSSHQLYSSSQRHHAASGCPSHHWCGGGCCDSHSVPPCNLNWLHHYTGLEDK